MELTPYNIAKRFLGMRETPGAVSNPAILAMLQLDAKWPKGDHVAWCSAFACSCCFLAAHERSTSLRARSWLRVGVGVVQRDDALVGDIVVLKRGGGPGPEVIDAPGHVGFLHAVDGGTVEVLGGNQGDAVTIADFPVRDILGIRRLREEST